MSEHIQNVTDTSFQSEVLESSTPILVDYWAEWCGPCRMVGPVIEESAPGYAGRLRFAKLNIDENPRTPSQYGIRSIPTLMLFKDGKPVATQVGAVSRSQLSAFLDANL